MKRLKILLLLITVSLWTDLEAVKIVTSSCLDKLHKVKGGTQGTFVKNGSHCHFSCDITDLSQDEHFTIEKIHFVHKGLTTDMELKHSFPIFTATPGGGLDPNLLKTGRYSSKVHKGGHGVTIEMSPITTGDSGGYVCTARTKQDRLIAASAETFIPVLGAVVKARFGRITSSGSGVIEEFYPNNTQANVTMDDLSDLAFIVDVTGTMPVKPDITIKAQYQNTNTSQTNVTSYFKKNWQGRKIDFDYATGIMNYTHIQEYLGRPNSSFIAHDLGRPKLIGTYLYANIKSQASIILNLHFPPADIKCPSSPPTFSGKDLILTCQFSSNPPPTAYYLKLANKTKTVASEEFEFSLHNAPNEWTYFLTTIYKNYTRGLYKSIILSIQNGYGKTSFGFSLGDLKEIHTTHKNGETSARFEISKPKVTVATLNLQGTDTKQDDKNKDTNEDKHDDKNKDTNEDKHEDKNKDTNEDKHEDKNEDTNGDKHEDKNEDTNEDKHEDKNEDTNEGKNEDKNVDTNENKNEDTNEDTNEENSSEGAENEPKKLTAPKKTAATKGNKTKIAKKISLSNNLQSADEPIEHGKTKVKEEKTMVEEHNDPDYNLDDRNKETKKGILPGSKSSLTKTHNVTKRRTARKVIKKQKKKQDTQKKTKQDHQENIKQDLQETKQEKRINTREPHRQRVVNEQEIAKSSRADDRKLQRRGAESLVNTEVTQNEKSTNQKPATATPQMNSSQISNSNSVPSSESQTAKDKSTTSVNSAQVTPVNSAQITQQTPEGKTSDDSDVVEDQGDNRTSENSQSMHNTKSSDSEDIKTEVVETQKSINEPSQAERNGTSVGSSSGSKSAQEEKDDEVDRGVPSSSKSVHEVKPQVTEEKHIKSPRKENETVPVAHDSLEQGANSKKSQVLVPQATLDKPIESPHKMEQVAHEIVERRRKGTETVSNNFQTNSKSLNDVETDVKSEVVEPHKGFNESAKVNDSIPSKNKSSQEVNMEKVEEKMTNSNETGKIKSQERLAGPSEEKTSSASDHLQSKQASSEGPKEPGIKTEGQLNTSQEVSKTISPSNPTSEASKSTITTSDKTPVKTTDADTLTRPNEQTFGNVKKDDIKTQSQNNDEVDEDISAQNESTIQVGKTEAHHANSTDIKSSSKSSEHATESPRPDVIRTEKVSIDDSPPANETENIITEPIRPITTKNITANGDTQMNNISIDPNMLVKSEPLQKKNKTLDDDMSVKSEPIISEPTKSSITGSKNITINDNEESPKENGDLKDTNSDAIDSSANNNESRLLAKNKLPGAQFPSEANQTTASSSSDSNKADDNIASSEPIVVERTKSEDQHTKPRSTERNDDVGKKGDIIIVSEKREAPTEKEHQSPNRVQRMESKSQKTGGSEAKSIEEKKNNNHEILVATDLPPESSRDNRYRREGTLVYDASSVTSSGREKRQLKQGNQNDKATTEDSKLLKRVAPDDQAKTSFALDERQDGLEQLSEIRYADDDLLEFKQQVAISVKPKNSKEGIVELLDDSKKNHKKKKFVKLGDMGAKGNSKHHSKNVKRDEDDSRPRNKKTDDSDNYGSVDYGYFDYGTNKDNSVKSDAEDKDSYTDPDKDEDQQSEVNEYDTKDKRDASTLKEADKGEADKGEADKGEADKVEKDILQMAEDYKKHNEYENLKRHGKRETDGHNDTEVSEAASAADKADKEEKQILQNAEDYKKAYEHENIIKHTGKREEKYDKENSNDLEKSFGNLKQSGQNEGYVKTEEEREEKARYYEAQNEELTQEIENQDRNEKDKMNSSQKRDINDENYNKKYEDYNEDNTEEDNIVRSYQRREVRDKEEAYDEEERDEDDEQDEDYKKKDEKQSSEVDDYNVRKYDDEDDYENDYKDEEQNGDNEEDEDEDQVPDVEQSEDYDEDEDQNGDDEVYKVSRHDKGEVDDEDTDEGGYKDEDQRNVNGDNIEDYRKEDEQREDYNEDEEEGNKEDDDDKMRRYDKRRVDDDDDPVDRDEDKDEEEREDYNEDEDSDDENDDRALNADDDDDDDDRIGKKYKRDLNDEVTDFDDEYSDYNNDDGKNEDKIKRKDDDDEDEMQYEILDDENENEGRRKTDEDIDYGESTVRQYGRQKKKQHRG